MKLCAFLARYIGLLAMLLALPSVYATDIYRYTDEAGRVVYTNVPPKSKRKSMHLVTEQISVIPAVHGMLLETPGTPQHTKRHENMPDDIAGIPTQVDSTTQQDRDNTRRGILLNELDNEVKALSDDQKQIELQLSPTISNSPPHTTNTSPALQQSIQSHQRNIDALHKELGIR